MFFQFQSTNRYFLWTDFADNQKKCVILLKQLTFYAESGT